MKRKKDLPQAAAEMTHTAAERSAELYDAAKTKITPLIGQAEKQLDGAKKQGAKMAANTIEKAQPAIDDVFTKVQGDLLPKLTDALRQIAEIDQVPLSKRQIRKAEKSAAKLTAEAQRNTNKALKKASKDLKPRRSAAKTVGSLAVAAALIGGAIALLRRYLASNNESGWAAHEPSTGYAGKPTSVKTTVDDVKRTAAQDVKAKAADLKDQAADKVTDLKDKLADKAEDAKDATLATAKKATDKVDEAKDATLAKAKEVKDDVEAQDKTRKADAAPLADAVDGDAVGSGKYGDGSFEGANPPVGYVIKGNERSMKYHVAGTGGYERTIADVWFINEQAAESAGFTKAQR